MASAKANQESPFHKALNKMNVNWIVENGGFRFLLPNGHVMVISLRDIEAMISQAMNIPITAYVNYGPLSALTFHDILIQEMKVIIHKYKKGFTEGYKQYDSSQGRGNERQWKQTFNENFRRKEKDKAISGSPYDILGVREGATKDEIKKAYRKKMQQWHPDRNPGNKEAEAMCKKINQAYATLHPKH